MPDFDAVYRELRAILATHASSLSCKRDSPTELYLDTPTLQKNGTPLFFGAVQVKKSHVSYHLMPLYTDPDLLDTMPDTLRRHMHGKSCFNFKTVGPAETSALAELTRRAFDRYREHGHV